MWIAAGLRIIITSLDFFPGRIAVAAATFLGTGGEEE
jgi:hypothetical protein